MLLLLEKSLCANDSYNIMSHQIHNDIGSYNRRGEAILGISIAFAALEAVAVALRFLSRRRLGAKWRIDDWLILVALIPNYAMVIIFGFGKSNANATIPTWLRILFQRLAKARRECTKQSFPSSS